MHNEHYLNTKFGHALIVKKTGNVPTTTTREGKERSMKILKKWKIMEGNVEIYMCSAGTDMNIQKLGHTSVRFKTLANKATRELMMFKNDHRPKTQERGLGYRDLD